jgi:hypothetical protein
MQRRDIVLVEVGHRLRGRLEHQQTLGIGENRELGFVHVASLLPHRRPCRAMQQPETTI